VADSFLLSKFFKPLGKAVIVFFRSEQGSPAAGGTTAVSDRKK